MRRAIRLTIRSLTMALMAALTVTLLAVPVARAAETVDLLLVFAADVSRSIDQQKFQLQRDGYAAAMVNWRFMANAVWTTDETVKKMKAAASA